ncbi:MAG: VOC family protein [Saprospiraceae bacterium]|nr:VOC family protein [Saprospiraceae bacterium]
MNLNQVTVPSLDIAKSILFYKQLRLKLIVDSAPHYARFQCLNGDATFSIIQVNQLPVGDGVHIYFECENLDEFVQELSDKNIEIDEMPVDKTWLWREARLKDPDGNQLILYYAGENRLNPPWKIQSE